MTTDWTLPTTFLQYSEEGGEENHIPWNNDLTPLRNSDGRFLQSNGALHHISRSPKPDIKNKTYYIKLTGYNFYALPNELSGIEVRLRTRRYGRATDDTIQLVLNDENVGENKADLKIHNENIYGGGTDLWNTNLTIEDLQDPSFGIIIRFKAHPNWPHRDPIFVDSVEMRIH